VSELKAYILCRFANNSGIYTSWMDQLSIPTVILDEYLPDWHVPNDAGILITHMHYRWEELSTLRNVVAQNRIPVLILSDGILEYRNTWEHPDLVDGSIFQPLIGHKLACIGRGQARVVESWGNAGKCEVVGLPRLDSINSKTVQVINSNGPFRVMIATANTPAFDEVQRASVVESLNYVKQWVESNQAVNGRPVEITWRLSDGLESEIGVGEDVDPEERTPIGEVIESVDAVITTPSTMYLESVLRGRPTAILDFHNSPHYVMAAWTISGPHQMDWAMGELAAPSKHKMMFQEFVLNDQLECRSAAAPRMLKLIDAMVAAGAQARKNGAPIELSPRIITDEQNGFAAVPNSFDLASLYDDNEVFKNRELAQLQIELAAAIKRLEQLPGELAEKNRFIGQLNRSLDRSRMRVEDMHNRVVAIRKRFGVEPSKPEVDGRDIVDNVD
jgi:uncharacterized coiled-coil protein SlyX